MRGPMASAIGVYQEIGICSHLMRWNAQTGFSPINLSFLDFSYVIDTYLPEKLANPNEFLP